MVQHVRLDDRDYDVGLLSQEGLQTLALYQYATQQYQETTNMLALLTKARNAYIAELKYEIVKGSSGVDLDALFDDG